MSDELELRARQLLKDRGAEDTANAVRELVAQLAGEEGKDLPSTSAPSPAASEEQVLEAEPTPEPEAEPEITLPDPPAGYSWEVAQTPSGDTEYILAPLPKVE